MRKFVLAGLMAALGSLVAVAPAAAMVDYCDWEPILVITTPDGNLVPVFDSVYTNSVLKVGLPIESYTATRAFDGEGNPVTQVDLSVYVPSGLLIRFNIRADVTTGPMGTGDLLGRSLGVSNHVTHVRFTLPQS